MAGRQALPFVIWGAAVGEDFEVLDRSDEYDDAIRIVEEFAAQGQHQFIQITKGLKGRIVQRITLAREVAWA